MKRGINVIKSTLSEFSDDRCWTLAAALAFYTIFSLPWILLIIVYVAGAFFGHQAASGELSQRLQSVTSPQLAGEIQSLLQAVSKPEGRSVWATVVSIGAIIVSSTSAFSELQLALNRAWEVQPQDSSWTGFATKRFTSFLLIIAIGIVMLASMALGAVVTAAQGVFYIPFANLLAGMWQNLFSWGLVTLLVAAIFRVLPDAKVGWRDVLIGAMFTGILLVAGKYGMSVYLAHSSVGSTFGGAGSLAILMLWLYYSAAILLLGAEFTREWSRSAGREVKPQEGAVRIEKRPAA